MHLNIAHKIFGIAVIVFVLMAVGAIYSLHLTAAISDELDTIVRVHMPLDRAVSRLNVRVLERSIEVRHARAEASRLDALDTQIEREFMNAQSLLRGTRKESLRTTLAAIRERNQRLNLYATEMLGARAKGDEALYQAMLPMLDNHRDGLDADITAMRRSVAQETASAVMRADRNKRRLLVVHAVLSGLAAILGLGLSALVTRAMVRNVRNLVRGTAEVEAGILDVEVEPTSQDEVGALTRSFNHMIEGLRLKERIKETFGKYMDPRIVGTLLENPEISTPGGERREMTVMFIDLKGFTSISEGLPADELVSLINSFFSHTSKAIADNSGVIDKYMGDAVMAYWGSPFTGTNEHARLACRAALDGLEHLVRFGEDVRNILGAAADGLDIDLRIGVSSGEMVVGTIGSEVARNFTVIGDPVNLGSRLEGANKAYGTRILISENTRELIGDEFLVREIDLMQVQGKVVPIRIFELLNDSEHSADLPISAREQFALGLDHYRAQNWAAAQEAFRASHSSSGGDAAAQTYLGRIDHFQENPPPADWDGVWIFETK